MKKQNKLKFNIVDVIVLLVLLVGIVFVAMRFIGSDPEQTESPDPEQTETPGPDYTPDPVPTDSSGPDEIEEKDPEYIITFYASESADYIVDHLFIGSPLTDDSISWDLGVLVDFETGPARISSSAADGHLVISDLEGYSSVYLMGRATGYDNGFGVTVDGLKLEIGHSMVLRTKEAKFWVYVYDIQKLEDTPYAELDIPGMDDTPDEDDVPDADDTPDADDVPATGARS